MSTWHTSSPSSSSEASDRYIASGVGGAMLGASIGFGAPGAIVGLLVGVAVALSVNTQMRRLEQDEQGSHEKRGA